MKLEFASLTVTYFVHSTEDADRLNSSVRSALGLTEEDIVTEMVSGHYGNKILAVRAHVTGIRAQELCFALFRNLTPSSKTTLESELDKSIDEHDALYLRLDRQTIDAKLSLSSEEPIRIKMKPRVRSGGHRSMVQSYKELIR